MIGAGTTPQRSDLNDPAVRAEAQRRCSEVIAELPPGQQIAVLLYVLTSGQVPEFLIEKLKAKNVCVLPDCPDHEL